MTDDELSLKIAQFLEPKPERAKKILHRGSRLGAWLYGFQGDNPMPRDFVNDPACTLLLLGKLGARKPDGDIHLEHGRHTGWQISTCRSEDWEGWIRGNRIGKLIAEAFAKANNLI
jgi:hypothetical protein